MSEELIALRSSLVSRRIVDVVVATQPHGRDGESLYAVTLLLDNGEKLSFTAIWCNDSTADLDWDVEPA